MKNTPLFCSLFLFMVAFFLSSSFALAQNTESLPKAFTISEFCIMLDADAIQNANVLKADISNLQLTKLQQTNLFFGFFYAIGVAFETSIATQQVVARLIPNAEKQNWTVQEGGIYLKNKVTAQKEQFGTYIDFTKK